MHMATCRSGSRLQYEWIAKVAGFRNSVVGALREHEQPGRSFDERSVARVEAPLEGIVHDGIGAERLYEVPSSAQHVRHAGQATTGQRRTIDTTVVASSRVEARAL